MASLAVRHSQGKDLAPPWIEPSAEPGGGVRICGARRPGESHSPWLTDRGRPARQRDGPQVRDSFETVEVGDEELPAPHRPVGAVAEPVKSDPENGAGVPVLGQARGDVCVVMLHGPRLDVEIESVLGRQVLRVQVVRDDLWLDPEQPAQVNRRLQE